MAKQILRFIVYGLLLMSFDIPAGTLTAMEATTASDDEARAFLARWLELSQDNNDFDAVMTMYADTVDFYKLGRVKKDAVRADKRKYFDRWPMREHVLTTITVSPGNAVNEMKVGAVFHYKINDGKKSLQGDADTILVLRKENGKVRIVSEKEGTREKGSPTGSSAGNDDEAKKQLLGEHLLSLQWISWDHFGKAVVTEQNGALSIKGEQKSEKNDDYVTINGIVTKVGAGEFTFTGTIITKISYINGGKPCKREGEMTFRITGKRRYWRLVQMDNPCDQATDYVDIYLR